MQANVEREGRGGLGTGPLHIGNARNSAWLAPGQARPIHRWDLELSSK
jgi:hypothetical protein